MLAHIKTFREISKDDAQIAGGKGASLGEMTQAGIPVPGGFVVLASTFDHFLKETDLIQEVHAVLGSVDHKAIHTIDDASEKIQALILNAAMPDSIASEIIQQFSSLGAEFVAVRSSATAEDGAEHAWAGQLDSYLNTTEAELLKNVQRCWASLFTPRAIFYRFEKGLNDTSISVAVVVQEMVQSEVSGVSFSVHPVTEDYNQLVIEAGFGLGEAIVSGQVTPDTYVVAKSPRQILDKNVAVQSRGLYRDRSGGNAWRDIPSAEGGSQVLFDDQILELSELVLKIEAHYGFPCDIEWGLENDQFSILQSRPITTLPAAASRVGGSALKLVAKIATRFYPPVIFEFGQMAQVEGIKALIGDGFTTTLASYDGNVMHMYRMKDDLDRLRPKMVEFVSSNHFMEEADVFARRCSAFEETLEGGSVMDLPKIRDAFVELYAVSAVGFYVGNMWPDDLPEVRRSDVVDTVMKCRKSMDRALVGLEAFVNRVRKEKGIDSALVTYDYLLDGKGLSPEDLSGGFSAGFGEFSLESWADFLGRHGYEIEKEMILSDSSGRVSGQSAWPGLTKGKVRVLLSPNDSSKVEEGDILVAPMTTPQYVVAMEKAAAIITDEGGITCHAAIVARELKKPCIIGTKVSTQALKDGDLVEVDADNGVVRKL